MECGSTLHSCCEVFAKSAILWLRHRKLLQLLFTIFRRQHHQSCGECQPDWFVSIINNNLIWLKFRSVFASACTLPADANHSRAVKRSGITFKSVANSRVCLHSKQHFCLFSRARVLSWLGGFPPIFFRNLVSRALLKQPSQSAMDPKFKRFLRHPRAFGLLRCGR